MLTEKICPYPGLRPFTEDESIYFKGREEHIGQIVSLLEKKKFVMLTGASGDGKSSLVYAGVIPNARAGFFKAKYNNWAIADFRPERTPLSNCASALAGALGLEEKTELEKKFGTGYSALIKAYKSSPLYLDTNDEKWKNTDEAGKKQLKRKASNLLILVDQFEEFFTNTENFTNGRPSLESQTVINLLLETAKIALAEDLPVYIICTMRSDYIGQCASFRGLPEYIGFSQFFVPRLKRKELVQVIEEPALLSGNKISKRLVEVLINELNEGIDQLPVLQHALNQIWKIANEENVDMDLLHFAKLSGMPVNQLPDEDKEKFDLWFRSIPDFKKEYFKNPSLSNVLDAHANELFETAHDYYFKTTGKEISKEEAKKILVNVFKSLTKIDEGRAVRNRSTLLEITEIINDKTISTEKVTGVVNLFREQGNTFIRPFIVEDEKSKKLELDTVLDITHESLIRNWNLLVEWTNQEETNLLNFHDFKKQMQRWAEARNEEVSPKNTSFIKKLWNRGKANRKSKNFLLPKGPLAFFDGWFQNANINPFWLLKYDQRSLSNNSKKEEAESLLEKCKQFLARSRRVFTIKKWVLGASIIWALFWFCYMWYVASQDAEEEKIKTEKLDKIKFDQLNTKVVAPSSYIALGQPYTADIFIAASSSQFSSRSPLDPKIYLGKMDTAGNLTAIYDSVPIEGGMGHYSMKTTTPGEHVFEGEIQIKSPSGKIQRYPFNASYMVAGRSMIVSADKMNVFYIGIENPISVSVEGVSPGDLIISGSGAGCSLKPLGPKKYAIIVSEPGEVIINVSGRTKSGIVSFGKSYFRSKDIPDPSPDFGGITGSSKINRQKLLSTKFIEAKLSGFDWKTKFRITSFDMVLISEKFSTILSNPKSGDITKEMENELKKLKKGSKIIFNNINCPKGRVFKRNLSPIVLELED